jgi:hypothetical protein
VTATNHALTGAVIALAINEPWLAIPLAFISHFAVDALPHWDYAIRRNQPHDDGFIHKHFFRLLSADLVVASILFIVLALMFPQDKWLIWACMAAAACSDAMWAYYRIYLPKFKGIKPKLNRLARFHKDIQRSQTPKGALVESGWFILCWAIILNLR